MSRRGLGKGLRVLIPESSEEKENVQEIEVAQIRPNPHQPRQAFDEAKLAELAASIREHGVVQPVLVRPVESGYELVAGERRWRAAQMAGLDRIPAIVRDLTPAQVMEIALIENLQREDLNPLEEAEAYRRLIEEFHLTQEELARRLGKSRSQIANTLRLLNLPEPVRSRIAAGTLSVGHAKVLLGLSDPGEQVRLADRVEREQLSVRQLEALIAREGRRRSHRSPREAKDGAGRNADLMALEAALRERLGTPVRILPGQPRGKIEIAFYGDEDLARIYDLIMGTGQEPLGPGRPPGPFHV
ncbi:MAG: ParB/RepB/Spo0J family partition protein [Firmicutes bacterium]|nr:ParB/RepB/Spo0J family partition protein [Bacillota bacterium]